MLTNSPIMGPNTFLFGHKPVGLRNVTERVSTNPNHKYLAVKYCFPLIPFIKVDTWDTGLIPILKPPSLNGLQMLLNWGCVQI